MLRAKTETGVARRAWIIERYNLGNIVVDLGVNVDERLFVADAVLVTSSTAGLEAMLFGKPVLVVSDGGSEDPVGYVAPGAAIRVTTRGEVREAVKRSLEDPLFRDGFAEAQYRFVTKNFANVEDTDPLDRVRLFVAATVPAAPASLSAIAR